MDPILKLKISYYQLYLQEIASSEKRDVTENENATPPSACETEEITSDEPLWTSDTWTVEDEKAAQVVISQNFDKCQVPDTLRRRLPSDTQAWDRFYQTHQTNFFKDRHYLTTAFPNEFRVGSGKQTLVEIGCGVGNTLLPLLEDKNKRYGNDIEWTVYGVDLSTVAIDLLKKDDRFQRASRDSRAWAGVANLVADGLPEPCKGVADIATLLFCLSAVPPGDHATAAAHAVQALKPGGVLVIRDYGRYNQAKLQLAGQRAKRLTEHYYVKHNQTKCFYFSTQDLHQLFVKQEGLEELENGYIQRQYQNRGDGTHRLRVWVQARFRRKL